MMKLAKYLLLIIISAIPVGAVFSVTSIVDCTITGKTNNYCNDLIMSSTVTLFGITLIASIGVLIIGLPLFFALRNEGNDSFSKLVLWPSLAFAFVIFFLFEVYSQRSYLTFACFSFSWLFSAAMFWYAADKMALTSGSRATRNKTRAT